MPVIHDPIKIFHGYMIDIREVTAIGAVEYHAASSIRDYVHYEFEVHLKGTKMNVAFPSGYDGKRAEDEHRMFVETLIKERKGNPFHS